MRAVTLTGDRPNAVSVLLGQRGDANLTSHTSAKLVEVKNMEMQMTKELEERPARRLAARAASAILDDVHQTDLGPVTMWMEARPIYWMDRARQSAAAIIDDSRQVDVGDVEMWMEGKKLPMLELSGKN